MEKSPGKHQAVRVLPPWVHARDGTDELDRPSSTEKDSVQWTPSLNGHSTTAGTVAAPAAPHGSVWQSFITTTSPQAARASGDHVMNDSWMQRHMSNLEDPTLRQQEAEKRGKQSVAWYTSAAGRAFVWKVARRIILKSPVVPLIVRLTVLTFSSLALGIAAWLRRASQSHVGCVDAPSIILAISFDAAAIVYILFITWDEYSSKPLGLRSPKAKLRLIFLDLVFIVLDSANLSLALQAVTTHENECQADIGRPAGDGYCPTGVCKRQEALAGVLFIALAAWLITFAISTFRIVERFSQI